MDTAWIQVFVLTLSECIAPAGKTVCQEQQLQYQFADRANCEAVLEQLLEYKHNSEQVIVDADKSSCTPTIRQTQVFSSLDAANRELGDTIDWGALPAKEDKPDFTQTEHQERLAEVPACDSVGGVTPCKIGNIIIEGATVKKTEVWKQQ